MFLLIISFLQFKKVFFNLKLQLTHDITYNPFQTPVSNLTGSCCSPTFCLAGFFGQASISELWACTVNTFRIFITKSSIQGGSNLLKSPVLPPFKILNRLNGPLSCNTQYFLSTQIYLFY